MGTVTGNSHVGGLVGRNDGSVKYSYSAAAVSGTDPSSTGGIAGTNSGAITAGFFSTTSASGNVINPGLGLVGDPLSPGDVDAVSGGRTWAQLSTLSTFLEAGWDIDDQGGTGTAWRIYDGYTTPLIRSALRPLLAIANDQEVTYDGQRHGGAGFRIEGTYSIWDGLDKGSISGGGVDAGAYTLTVSGLYSNQLRTEGRDIDRGYDLILVDGTLTINQAPLSLVGVVVADKVYDGTDAAQIVDFGVLSGVVAGDDVTLDTSRVQARFEDAAPGAGKRVIITGLSLKGARAGNYALDDVIVALADIVDFDGPPPVTGGPPRLGSPSLPGTPPGSGSPSLPGGSPGSGSPPPGSLPPDFPSPGLPEGQFPGPPWIADEDDADLSLPARGGVTPPVFHETGTGLTLPTNASIGGHTFRVTASDSAVTVELLFAGSAGGDPGGLAGGNPATERTLPIFRPVGESLLLAGEVDVTREGSLLSLRPGSEADLGIGLRDGQTPVRPAPGITAIDESAMRVLSAPITLDGGAVAVVLIGVTADGVIFVEADGATASGIGANTIVALALVLA